MIKKLIIALLFMSLSVNAWATNFCKDASIIGCYPAQTNSGTSLIDFSPNGFNGAFASAGHPVWQTLSPSRSYLTYSVNFSSSSDYINLGTSDTTSFKPGQAMTFGAWIRPSTCALDASGGVGRVTARINSLEATIAIGSVGSATAAIQFNFGGSTNLSVITANNTCVVNTWTSIIVTWDGTNNATGVHIYINGVETTYQQQQNGITLTNMSASPLYLGNNSNHTREFDGNITEPFYLSRAMSAQEASNIFAYGVLQAGHGFPKLLIQ